MNRKIILSIAFVAFLISANQAVAADRVAYIETISDAINFYPEVPYAQLELTVAGDNFYWQKKYREGEIAMFSSFDEALPDGHYRYELIASPPYDKEAWELARDDRKLMRDLEVIERAETYRQFGRFEVVQGQIVLPTDPNES